MRQRRRTAASLREDSLNLGGLLGVAAFGLAEILRSEADPELGAAAEGCAEGLGDHLAIVEDVALGVLEWLRHVLRNHFGPPVCTTQAVKRSRVSAGLGRASVLEWCCR